MGKIFKVKEMRDLAFMVVAIMVTVALCVASMVRLNVFNVVLSILLLAILSIGLGYQYCKNEEKIGEFIAESEAEKKAKKESKKAKADESVFKMNFNDEELAEIKATLNGNSEESVDKGEIS